MTIAKKRKPRWLKGHGGVIDETMVHCSCGFTTTADTWEDAWEALKEHYLRVTNKRKRIARRRRKQRQMKEAEKRKPADDTTPNWRCTKDGEKLGKVVGFVASCPKCKRAFCCITDDDRKKSEQALTKRGKK